jgi:hypothetical protein
MKKKILTLLVLVAPVMSNGAFAQLSTASVTFNVVLANFSSITVSSSDVSVTLNYSTQANYATGVSVTQTQALTVQSESGFTVKTYAGGDLSGPSSNTLPAADFSVLPTSDPAVTGVTPVSTPVYFPNTSANAATIIHSTVGVTSAMFDLTYAGPGTSGTPSSNDFLGKPAGTYTTTVYYLLYQP